MGEERFTAAQERMGKDALVKLLGIKLTVMRPGYAEAVMEVTPKVLNGAGVTNGGAIFAMADYAFAAASNAKGPCTLAMGVNIHFLKTTGVGNTLTALAREEHDTRMTGLYRIEVLDEQGNLVAIAEGTAYKVSQ